MIIFFDGVGVVFGPQIQKYVDISRACTIVDTMDVVCDGPRRISLESCSRAALIWRLFVSIDVHGAKEQYSQIVDFNQ